MADLVLTPPRSDTPREVRERLVGLLEQDLMPISLEGEDQKARADLITLQSGSDLLLLGQLAEELSGSESWQAVGMVTVCRYALLLRTLTLGLGHDDSMTGKSLDLDAYDFLTMAWNRWSMRLQDEEPVVVTLFQKQQYDYYLGLMGWLRGRRIQDILDSLDLGDVEFAPSTPAPPVPPPAEPQQPPPPTPVPTSPAKPLQVAPVDRINSWLATLPVRSLSHEWLSQVVRPHRLSLATMDLTQQLQWYLQVDNLQNTLATALLLPLTVYEGDNESFAERQPLLQQLIVRFRQQPNAIDLEQELYRCYYALLLASSTEGPAAPLLLHFKDWREQLQFYTRRVLEAHSRDASGELVPAASFQRNREYPPVYTLLLHRNASQLYARMTRNDFQGAFGASTQVRVLVHYGDQWYRLRPQTPEAQEATLEPHQPVTNQGGLMLQMSDRQVPVLSPLNPEMSFQLVGKLDLDVIAYVSSGSVLRSAQKWQLRLSPEAHQIQRPYPLEPSRNYTIAGRLSANGLPAQLETMFAGTGTIAMVGKQTVLSTVPRKVLGSVSVRYKLDTLPERVSPNPGSTLAACYIRLNQQEPAKATAAELVLYNGSDGQRLRKLPLAGLVMALRSLVIYTDNRLFSQEMRIVLQKERFFAVRVPTMTLSVPEGVDRVVLDALYSEDPHTGLPVLHDHLEIAQQPPVQDAERSIGGGGRATMSVQMHPKPASQVHLHRTWSTTYAKPL